MRHHAPPPPCAITGQPATHWYVAATGAVCYINPAAIFANATPASAARLRRELRRFTVRDLETDEPVKQRW
jgi:hypothetical protein